MAKQESRIVSIRRDEIIDSEAADWLTKLDRGELTVEERIAFKKWLSKSPEHASALKAMASMWMDMNYLLNDYPDAQTEPVRERSSAFYRPRQFAYALSLVLLCIAGLAYWKMAVPPLTEHAFYTTRLGEQSQRQFVDGSTAHLNTHSMIETEFTGSERVVRLLRGEALFDVVHDPDRPFVVYAGNQMVKAIGTKFVVRLDSSSILVTVTDGQVQLSSRHKSNLGDALENSVQEVILVSKGEQVEVTNAGPENTSVSKPVVVENQELESSLSWLNGQLVFDQKRLEEVIEEVGRYLPNQIIIDDPELRDILISGRFQAGDTEALLEAIEVSFNVKARQMESGEIHLFTSAR